MQLLMEQLIMAFVVLVLNEKYPKTLLLFCTAVQNVIFPCMLFVVLQTQMTKQRTFKLPKNGIEVDVSYVELW
jgi:hypothetical protein